MKCFEEKIGKQFSKCMSKQNNKQDFAKGDKKNIQNEALSF